MNFRNDPTLADVRELCQQWDAVLQAHTHSKRVQNHDVAHATLFFAGMTLGKILASVRDHDQLEQVIDHHTSMLREYIYHGIRIADEVVTP